MYKVGNPPYWCQPPSPSKLTATIVDTEAEREVNEELRALCDIADPADRARQASDLVAGYQASMIEISRIRREALDDLVSQGMTHAEIAAKIGTTRARVSQLLTSGPRPERAFLGSGTITVAIGGKLEQGRSDTSQQPVVSAEAVQAYETLSVLARSLNLQATQEVVPPPGFVQLNRTNLIVLTSPRLLPFVGQVLDSDSRYGFASDDQGWYLVDRETRTDYRSPRDADEELSDYAYIGRLPRPDGRGTFLYLAGIHAVGTLGAAKFIEEHIEDLYRELKSRRFSVLVKCQCNSLREVVSVTALTPIHRHEGV